VAQLPENSLTRISEQAQIWVSAIRNTRLSGSGLDAFLAEYDLSNEEGIALMCMAEALLRIPDNETRNKLIRDKVGMANWQLHAGKSESMFVNAATWGLMLTGKIYSWSSLPAKNLAHALKRLPVKVENL
jgi:RHH-type proline utilization regulon transcriptional repressor/proline dehydrogenase/delta 1-pyrroline-5-carboxylate dehydrogenase